MLLRELGWNIKVKVPTAEESAVQGENPEEMVCRLAHTKALSVYNESPGSWVIGADTVVVAEIISWANHQDICQKCCTNN